MPINTTTPSNNSGVTDVPIYQDWSPLPREIQLIKSINIPGAIASFTEEILVKDVIPFYPASSDFRLVVISSYIPSNVVPWIIPFMYPGSTGTDAFQLIPIEENGMVLNYPVQVANIALLPLGTYRFRQAFSIQKKLGFAWQTISSVTHDTVLNIVNDLVFYNPKTLTYNHIVNTTLPTRDVVFNGPEWKLEGNYRFTLSSLSPDVEISTYDDSNGQEYQVASGTGEATVKVTLGEYFNEPPPVNPILVIPTNYLKVLVGTQHVGNVNVRVRKFYTDVFELSPLQLFFVAEKNITDAAPQNLIFTCNVDYEIEASVWLTTTVQTIEIDGNPTQVITVEPLSASNMERGIYIGFVKVKAYVDVEWIEKSVSINYTISDLVDNPYLLNQKAFTLDNKFMSFVTFNQETYIQMEIKIIAYDFYTNTPKAHSFLEKIGLFKGKSKVNIGKTVHQILSKDKEINENVFQYLPASVTVNFDEKNLSDNEIVRSASYSNIQFLAGLSNNFSKIGFLKFNHLPERVTVKSEKYLNIFVPSGIHKIIKYKNNQPAVEDFLLESEGKVMTIKVGFQDCIQGDKIQYKIINDGDGQFLRLIESSTITFIVFPEGKYSNEIVWEDEFLLKQCIECTGNYAFKSNLEFISQKKYINLVEHLSHLDVTKASKFSINTGWLMQSDVDTIESLMKSKKVWINANGKTIFMVPISENIVSQDSERELVDYSIEFQINPSYNEETYRL